MKRYETIVVGLGAAGSAALHHLAKRGSRALGIDRFAPPHAYGSSHGDTRITRLAIGEGEHYTPLAIRSHALWRMLERESGTQLLTANGALVISSAKTSARMHVTNFFANTVAAAKRFGIAHETLDAAAIRRRFPPFAVRDGEIAYFEPGAGFVRPEACIGAQLAIARAHGAEILCNETVVAIEPSDAGVAIVGEDACFRCDVAIVCAGAWLPSLLDAPLAQRFAVHRQTLFWFDVDGPIGAFAPERFPVFIWELPHGRNGVYGFPAIDGARGGVKIGTESFAHTTTPDACERTVSEREIDAMHALIEPYLPALSRTCVRAATCLYTVTPDFGFVVDALPGASNVLIASPCSGHGFKHSPAIGEMLAQWAVERRKPDALAPFSFARFDSG